MTTQPYSYVVLRYMPDAGAGEALNIGVVVYSRDARFLRLHVDECGERLSRAFAGFSELSFRRAMANLVAVFRSAGDALLEGPLLTDDRGFDDWLTALMPDTGASVAFTPPRHGITTDLGHETLALFERMVTSQQVRQCQETK
jgi:hypothetical protein